MRSSPCKGRDRTCDDSQIIVELLVDTLNTVDARSRRKGPEAAVGSSAAAHWPTHLSPKKGADDRAERSRLRRLGKHLESGTPDRVTDQDRAIG